MGWSSEVSDGERRGLQRIGDGLLEAHRSPFGARCCKLDLVQLGTSIGEQLLEDVLFGARERAAHRRIERLGRDEESYGVIWSPFGGDHAGQTFQAPKCL